MRIILAIPALFLSAALGGAGSFRVPYRGRYGRYGGGGGGALAGVCAFLGWFAILARGRMPKGLRDAGAYSIGYSAQMLAYVLLVTDRYPNADPTAMLATVERPPQHQVYLVGDAHDLRHSRVLVFFRLPLLIPHLIWLALWTVAAVIVGILNWFATLFTGTPARAVPPLPLGVRPVLAARLRVRSISPRTRSRASPAKPAAIRSTSCSPSGSVRTVGSPASGSSSRSRPSR